ncbi:hypothetical protein N7527_007700 [Penicillium freii]|nr:hypothetical protein N7527_007700 [Penicillium freii]
MSLLRTNFPGSGDFSSLFRLLDDYDDHRSSRNQRAPPAEAKEGKDTDETKPTHRFWASERSVGEFQRVFSFPTPVDQHNVKASLKHGILSIKVPKTTAATSKKITIE